MLVWLPVRYLLGAGRSRGTAIGIRNLANRILGSSASSTNWWLWRTPDYVSYSTSAALQIPAVARCIKLISGDAGRLPVIVQQTEDGKNWENQPDSNIGSLFNFGPNPELSGNEWRSWVFRDLAIYGNHLSLIERAGSGEVYSLQPQSFGTWSVNWNRDRGILSYNAAGVGNVAPADVLHIRLDGESPFWGVSPLEQHSTVLKTILAQYAAAERTFTSTLGKVALKTDDQLSPEAVQRIQEKFAETHGNASSWDSPIVTGGGMEAKVFQNELSRNEYVNSQNFGVADVGRIYGVPASMLYATDQAGLTSSGSGQREVYGYIETGLRPLLSRFASHVALKLLNPGQRIVFDTRALSRGSYGEAVASLRQAIDAGIISPAEARNALEMPPAPPEAGLDEFVISKNYTTQSSTDADDVGVDTSMGVSDD